MEGGMDCSDTLHRRARVCDTPEDLQNMYTGLGSTLVVGPRVLSYQDSGTLQFAQPMDADERQTYRDLLAAGLDEEMPVLLQPTIRRSLTLRKLMRKQVRRASKREAE